MKLHNKESEGQIRLKGNVKRMVSGLLSVVTVLSAFLQPAGVYAAEPGPAAYKAEYPALEEVKARLGEDEIVTASDYTVEMDSGFDVGSDFFGLEFSPDKVKVIFHEAKSRDGKEFDIGKAGVYKAVYFVEPASKNPSYHISRDIIVKQRADVKPVDGGQVQESAGIGADIIAEEASEGEGTGLTVEGAVRQVQERGIDLMGMEEGESITFYASAAARSVEIGRAHV